MASERRVKKGLSHWPCDSNFFDDIKIRKLIRYQGGKAPLVYICLLCDIYGEYGYYKEWDDELPFVVSEKLGTGYDEGYVLEVIKACVSLGLFDEVLYEQGVLTSVAIQERFIEICQKSKRKYGIDKYDLLSSKTPELFGGQEKNSEDKAYTPEDNTELNRTELNTPPISEEIVPPLKNSEESNDVPEDDKKQTKKKPQSLEERKHEFGTKLIPYIDKYGPEMIRAFFNHWTEHNEGGTKMKFEIEKTRGGTFNIGGRLATWKKNEEKWARGGQNKRGSTITEAVQATAIPETGLAGPLDITKLIQ